MGHGILQNSQIDDWSVYFVAQTERKNDDQPVVVLCPEVSGDLVVLLGVARLAGIEASETSQST